MEVKKALKEPGPVGLQTLTQDACCVLVLLGALGPAFISQKQPSGVTVNTLVTSIEGDLGFFLYLLNKLYDLRPVVPWCLSLSYHL